MDTGLSSFISRLPLKPRPLIAKQEIASGVFVLRFERSQDFLPGQVVGITTEKAIPARLYSICSGAGGDNYLEVLFNIKEDGILTPPYWRSSIRVIWFRFQSLLVLFG